MKLSIKKNINNIESKLKPKQSDYKIELAINFVNDTNFNYTFKVFNKAKVIKKLNTSIYEYQKVADELESQYNVKLYLADMDYLTTKQVKYLISVLENQDPN